MDGDNCYCHLGSLANNVQDESVRKAEEWYSFLANSPGRAVTSVQGKCDPLKISLLGISIEETKMNGAM